MATYNISTYAQLKAMSSHLSDDCVLLNNIDCSASETEDYLSGVFRGFIPIGTSALPFTGTFDGGGFTLSNLYINRSTTAYVGLFGKVLLSGGFIKNVILSNFNISGASSTGILAGSIHGGASDLTVSGVTVDGTVTGAGDGVGGLCGDATACTVYDCYANCTISVSGASTNGIGGMIGSISNVDCTPTCGSTGTISITGSTGSYFVAGGFVGKIVTGSTSNLTSCYSRVAIVDNSTKGSYSYAGGFVGFDDNAGIITLCAALGSVLSSGATPTIAVGGFIGSGGGTITKCYATGGVDATASAGTVSMGGFIGLNTSTAINNCYAHGDIGKLGIGAGTYSIGGFTSNLPTGLTIAKCYSTGYVNQSALHVGGFTGNKEPGATVSQASCLWDTTTSGILTSPGNTPATGKTTAQLILQTTTESAPFSFDYSSIWIMSAAITSSVAPSNLTVWLSETGDYENFEAGTKDSDSFQLTIPSTNEIRWCEAQESLLIGTAADEWKIASNKLETPLSPTNFGVKRQSGYGSALIQAMPVNEVLLFVDFVRRKIREMSYDSTSNKYICPDMTALAEHITKGQVKWISYQKNPDSILWVGLDNGDIRGFVYDREQNVTAWFKVILGGDFLCQSGCVVPGETEDYLYLVVDKHFSSNVTYNGIPVTYNGVPVVYDRGEKVYIIKTAARELTVLADAFYVDCGITFTTSGTWVDSPVYYGTLPVTYGGVPVVYRQYDSTAPTSIITGLDHLEGETVSILGDGIALDDTAVFNGQVIATLNGVVTPVYKAQVGLASMATVRPMRIVIPTQAGTSMGKVTHVNGLIISFYNTAKAKYGVDLNNLIEINFADPRWTNSSDIDGCFTGEVRVSVPGNFNPLNPIYVVSDGPTPITVRAIIADIEKSGG